MAWLYRVCLTKAAIIVRDNLRDLTQGHMV